MRNTTYFAFLKSIRGAEGFKQFPTVLDAKLRDYHADSTLTALCLPSEVRSRLLPKVDEYEALEAILKVGSSTAR